jgi:type II secretory pathway component PulC
MKKAETTFQSIIESKIFFTSAIIIIATMAILLLLQETIFYLDRRAEPSMSNIVSPHYQIETNGIDKISPFNPNCFFSAPEKASSTASSLAQRYRLAGTFTAFNEETSPETQGENYIRRSAILDDLQKNEQLLVQEGNAIPNTAINIIQISMDRITLKEGNREEELLLYFASSATNLIAATQINNLSQKELSNNSAVKGRFGIQVESNRWVLSRERLLDYYQELTGNTERLAKIYDSLKPVYAKNGKKIGGYVLDIEGEAETFKELGLRQGDIVRKVNSMLITSQARGEYFLREFVKNRINGFVVEIERNGSSQHLIYLVR